MTHRNARLTPVTRAELVEQVWAGWPQAEVARLFRVSRATVAKWVRRFREGGPDALLDRSSRPLRSPRQTDQLQEAAICATRRMPARARRFTWTSRNSAASRRVAASASCLASPRPTAALSAAPASVSISFT